MSIVLGANQYGKAENRVVRDLPRHRPTRDPGPERLHLAARRLRGCTHRRATRPTCCRPTPRRTPPSPTPRSTASPRPRTTRSPWAGTSSTPRRRQPAPDPGRGVRLGPDPGRRRRVTTTRSCGAAPRPGPCVVTVEGRGDEQQVWVVSGFADLTVLKSTGSEFKGFLKDELHDAAGDRRPDHGHRR